MKPSMVAMFGSIMPEPLTMPPTVTFLPSIVQTAQASFDFVSVVITAFAAASPCARVEPRDFAAALTPAKSLSIGRRRPITPVEATSISPGFAPSSPAVTRAVSSASFRPSAPVQAFAQPEFATIALMPRAYPLPPSAALS